MLNSILYLQFPNIKSFLQVSSGAVDMARSNLELMLTSSAKEMEGESATTDNLSAQKKSLHDVTYELVRQVTSPNTLVRDQVCKTYLNLE